MNALTLPNGFAEVESLLSRIDACFSLGFSRLGAEHLEGLASVARTFTGTPLGERMKQAVEGLARAEFREEHMVTIAAVRQALQGAQYDALVTTIADCGVAIKREDAPAKPTPAEPIPSIVTWMESTRQWLLEVALAGFMQIEQETVLPFIATLDQLQQHEESARLAMLLSGFVHELLDSMPVGNLEAMPLRRWSDLWARTMISALALPPYPEAVKVSGHVHLIGVDLRHHSHAISAVFHGILTPDAGQEGDPRHVKITASGYKVDVLDELEAWQVLDIKTFDALIEAYTRSKSLHIDGMDMVGAGDLLWDPSKAQVAKATDPFKVAREACESGIVLADVAPLDRHPVQLGVLVHLSDYKVTKKDDGRVLTQGDLVLPIDDVRVSTSSDLAEGAMTGSDECVGLLRFDASSWHLQPLLATKSKKVLKTGSSASLKIKSGSTLAILKERASKLLRAKA